MTDAATIAAGDTDASRLMPTVIQSLVGLLVLTVCTYLPVVCIIRFFVVDDFFGLFGAVFLLPLGIFIGLQQYRGTFQGRPDAAQRASIAFYVFAGIIAIMYIVNVGEYYTDGGRSLAVIVDLLFILTPIPPAILIGFVNQRRAKSLRETYTKLPELNPRRTVTLREMLAGVAILSGIVALSFYDLRAAPPNDAEHVTRDAAPFDLPENATDVSYHLGYRGTIRHEFTTDEVHFRRWVESGIGSIESERSGTKLEEINGEHRIMRYRYSPNLPDEEQYALIVDGLHYTWRNEDRGVHAAYDRRTGRAYYSAHYH